MLAKWQGHSLSLTNSQTTFRVRMEGSSRPVKTYHVNMLTRWEAPSAVCLLGKVVSDLEETQEVDIPTWPDNQLTEEVHINPELTAEQTREMKEVLSRHNHLFTDEPRRHLSR